MKQIQPLLWLALLILPFDGAEASQSAEPSGSAPAGRRAERVDMESLKAKFGTSDGKLEVVQQRLYSKSGKIELGTFAGSVSTDPFLNVNSGGVHLGLHLNEYFGLHLLYWKDFVKPSTALTEFETQNGFTVNTNNPLSYMGGELSFNPIYGKLSVMGASIVYYDLHLSAGVGQRSSESGKFIAPNFGLGQKVYLSQLFALTLDYRWFVFREQILEKVREDQRGQVIETRRNISGVVTFGLSFLLGT